ncbi:hypothetical protein PGT21_000013 [Puccinia graminis f. sp. tritici]|uniref:Uncharacterized protein n=1 Tax=Puccinia graminis f. sp. tritici TaxID=56615 RepID=A0A5B0MEE0_PUCGR|nr:hypothetical protein PGT21_000013 [Puccinia graminis f. sp. tritici]
MLIRNSDTAPRNIYWRGTQMMFQTWYHKGQNISQRSKPRQVYLTGELSMHLHTYLAFIRPTQMFLLRGLGEKTNAIDMQEFLWMGSRIGRLETPDFSRILKKYFLHGGCEGVGIRVWRQAAWIWCYADEELNFKLASQVWQAFWGIESLWASKQPPLPVPDTLPPGEKARQALTIFTRNPNALRTRLTTKREITFRPELQIDVQPKYASTADLVPILQGLTQSHILKKKDRAMIFIEHRESVALIAQAVGGLMHHSGMSDENNPRVQASGSNETME